MMVIITFYTKIKIFFKSSLNTNSTNCVKLSLNKYNATLQALKPVSSRFTQWMISFLQALKSDCPSLQTNNWGIFSFTHSLDLSKVPHLLPCPGQVATAHYHYRSFPLNFFLIFLNNFMLEYYKKNVGEQFALHLIYCYHRCNFRFEVSTRAT